MKVLLAFDSFKGCMSSHSAGCAAAEGVLSVYPNAEVLVLSVADGGEGTADALHAAVGGKWISVSVVDALLRPINASFLWLENSKTAIVEMAAAVGLTLINREDRCVEMTSSYGFGLLLRHALSIGAKHIVCTLGGSATNDAGLGALQALGLRVFVSDSSRSFRELNRPIVGSDLGSVVEFKCSRLEDIVANCSFSTLCDANIDFSGESGAVKMYAAQKGADEFAISRLESGMCSVEKCIASAKGVLSSSVFGAGAAGGAGYGLAAFLGAESLNGVDFVLDAVNFESALRGADLVITGEGKSDAQTLQGKLALGVLSRAKTVPTLLLSGVIEDGDALKNAGFSQVACINDGFSERCNPLDPNVASKRLKLATANLVQSLYMT